MISVPKKLLSVSKILQKLPHNLLVTRNIFVTLQQTQKMDSFPNLCTNIVWMDLELSGLNITKDKILEVSCLITDANLSVIAEGPCCAINHPESVFQDMNDWCMKHHYESGLVKKCLESSTTTDMCEKLIMDFLKKHIPKGQCPLAGNSVYMDRLFLRQLMPSVDDYLHYRIVDVSTIKELARRWNPKVLQEAPRKRFTHRSLEDIYDSIAELNYYRHSFIKIQK